MKFPNLSFMCQNVLSLNVSTKSSKTDLKILAITKGNQDIIILCDTRLNSSKQKAAIHDLTKKFRLRGYDFIHNSKSSSRGVAILIKKNLLWEIHRRIDDYGDNYLVLSITVSDRKFTLGAVYGPNINDLNFYDELQGSVLAMNNQTIILCGDWNATWDPSPVAYNMDVINMQNIPSKQRSEKIVQMARNLSITDPFRFLFPQKKDFTFVPNIAANKNRSRIDFFLISENIIGECKNVKIPHNLSSKTFDHKPVEMVFSHFHCKNTQVIKDTILKDPLLSSVMKIHAIDCYNNHASFDDVFTPNIRAEISRKIGIVLSEIANIKNIRLQKAEETDIDVLALLERRIALIENRVQNIFLEIPGIEFFENLNLTADADVFFETLVITLKNEALSFQSNFYKNKNATKKNLREQIKDLKLDYNTNKNLNF